MSQDKRKEYRMRSDRVRGALTDKAEKEFAYMDYRKIVGQELYAQKYKRMREERGDSNK